MNASQDNGKSAAEYGREALAQWREAARFGALAWAERRKEKSSAGSLKESVADADSGGSSELAELADAVLAKLGKGGKLAAKAGVGSRLVNRLVPSGEEPADEEEPDPAETAETNGSPAADAGDDESADDDHLFDDAAPIPIQESIDVAVPVAAVFDLCTRFEEMPRFSERIRDVAVEDGQLTVTAKIAGREQELALTIVGEEPEERIDWEGTDGIEHAGVVSFHPLAPRLTRIELTVERDSEGLRERLLRAAGVPERAIRQELRRFKAYAELWEEANDYKSADFKDPASLAADEAGEEEDEEAPEEAEESSEEEELEAAA